MTEKSEEQSTSAGVGKSEKQKDERVIDVQIQATSEGNIKHHSLE